MNLKRSIAVVALVALAVSLAIAQQPQPPNNVVVHWNQLPSTVTGQDSYRFTLVFPMQYNNMACELTVHTKNIDGSTAVYHQLFLCGGPGYGESIVTINSGASIAAAGAATYVLNGWGVATHN